MHTKLYARKVGGSDREKTQITDHWALPTSASRCWACGQRLLTAVKERDDSRGIALGPSLLDSVKTTLAKTEATFCKPAPCPTILSSRVRFPLADTWCTWGGSRAYQRALQRLFSLSWKTPGAGVCLTAARARAELVEAAAATFNLKSSIFPGGQMGTNICQRAVQSWLFPGD